VGNIAASRATVYNPSWVSSSRPPWLAGCLLAGCSSSALVVLEPSWPSNRTAVVVWLGDHGQLIAGPTLFEPSDTAATVSLPVGVPVRAVAYSFKAFSDNGPDFVQCGLTWGGAMTSLTPTVSYSTSLGVLRDQEVLTPTQDAHPAQHDLRYERTCAVPDICSRMKVKAVPIPALGKGAEVWLKQALPSADTLVFGGYELGTPGDQQIVYQAADQVANGTFAMEAVPGLRGTISDLAYDGRNTIYGTSTTSQLFKLRGDSAHWVSTTTMGVDPKALSLASGYDGTVIAYSSTAAYAIQGGQFQALPPPPPGITSLAVQTATSIAVIANSVLYHFDGMNWTGVPYTGDELHQGHNDSHPFPEPKLVAGPSAWAVIGAQGILIKRGQGPWRSLAAIGVPFPPNNEQPLSGTFLPDGTLMVGATDAVIDALSPDDSSWCAQELAAGVSIWLIDGVSASRLDGSMLVSFASKQGFNPSPFVVRVDVQP
jgi:hypothetical protein